MQCFVKKRETYAGMTEREREGKTKGMKETKAEWGEGRRERDFVLGWCWYYPWFPSGVGR